jgi:hypothetical protein
VLLGNFRPCIYGKLASLSQASLIVKYNISVSVTPFPLGKQILGEKAKERIP